MTWLKAAFFTVIFPGTVTGLVPWWILTHSRHSGAHAGVVAWSGLLLLVAAGLVLLRCIADFASKGRGTLAPIDPPKRLVVVGLYRWTRNPMYVAVLGILIGESLFFASLPLAFYSILVFTLVGLFVVLYEEPTLRRLFGEQYVDYCRRVPRWIGLGSKDDEGAGPPAE